jgi:deoxyribonucleoside regulator
VTFDGKFWLATRFQANQISAGPLERSTVMREDLSLERHELLAEIAELYYMGGLSQEAIASQVKLSRPSISRLLLEARELGIVEINVNQPIPTAPALEEQLAAAFSLQSVRVLERRGANDEAVFQMLGRLGATALNSIIKDNTTVGLSWGTAVHAVIQALRPRRLPGVKIVQLLGGIGAPYNSIDGPEQCRRAAEMFGAQHYYLNAPIKVDNPEVAAALLKDHSIKEVLELARQADIALIGIGSTNPEVSTQYHSGYMTFEDLRRLEKLGAVGSMCSSFFNLAGESVNAPWIDSCTISVNWEDLKQIGTVVAIAAGRRKAPAILGAVHSGIVNTLITDDAAAEAMLAMTREAMA